MNSCTWITNLLLYGPLFELYKIYFKIKLKLKKKINFIW
jgi:hypothetical protein